MTAFRVAQISDSHLSPRHGFFFDNFRAAAEAVAALRPALVVNTGDLSINGPDSEDELVFARRQHALFDAPVALLPGNHDVGDEPPGQDPAQLVTDARLTAWRRAVGPDRFCADIGAWRLIGLNALLFESGLDADAAQAEWLAARLAEAAGRPVGLFLHKPLFRVDFDADPASPACLTPAGRRRLLSLIEGRVRFVSAGHLHQWRQLTLAGIDLYWCPSTAFMSSHPTADGDPSPGFLSFVFDGGGVTVERHLPATLARIDLDALKGHGRYKFLRDMPEAPPPGAV